MYSVNFTSTIERNLAVDTFAGDLSSAIITGFFVILTSVLFTAGYRLLTFSSYIGGVLFGFIFSYLLLLEVTTLKYLLIICVSGSVAVINGFFAMQIPYLGLTVFAILSGISLGILQLVLLHYIWTICTYVLTGCMILGLTFIIITFSLLKLMIKPMTIINTAIISGVVVGVFLDRLIHHSAIVTHIRLILLTCGSDSHADKLAYYWLIVGSVPAISVLSILLQCLFTARGVKHELDCPCRKRENADDLPLDESFMASSLQTCSFHSLTSIPEEERFKTIYSRRMAVGELPTRACIKHVESAASLKMV